MAAYAALLSLSRSLQQILDLDPPQKENLVTIHEKVDSIVTFLEDYSDKHRGTYDRVRKEIRNAAYEAQDFMDSHLCSLSTTHYDRSSSEANSDHEVSLDRDLEMAAERIDFIWAETMEMKNNDAVEDLRSSTTYPSRLDHSSTVKITENKVVGFDDDLNAIKELIYEDSSKLQIIPIVGMGGIGKTTLARTTYQDSLRAQDFDIYAWTTVSGEYRRRDTLLELLQSLEKYTTDGNQGSGESEAQLAKQVYQNLLGRRYLIVIDDIWSTKAWDDLKMIFPDDGNGSRILLTSRLSEVAVYATSESTSIHKMKFLNEDQSWKLLEEKIFLQESCPPHLVELGKKVARNCGGLPLTIVVVAGLLLSSENMMDEDLWENILENISSTESTIPVQCSKILSLSYDWLPLRLKPCFLYIAAFREDDEIDISKLIMLWVAEGFLKPSNQSKTLEDVGKGCLEDLVNRNLILVSKKGPGGELKTIRIHDLLWRICITKAEEEGFLHHLSFTRNVCDDRVRRLVAHRLRQETFPCSQTQDSSTVRTIFAGGGDIYVSSLNFMRLSVLNGNSSFALWRNLSEVISKLVNLRYIFFTLGYSGMSNPTEILASLSKLPHLETIIADVVFLKKLLIPYEILRMPKLRHLITSRPCHLSDPSNIGIINKSDLQTLDKVINFIFSEDAIKTLVNLKRLAVVFKDKYRVNWDDFNLNNLSCLQNLVELEVSFSVYGLKNYIRVDGPPQPCLPWNYAFPISLTKLTLKEVPFPWENMTIIGSLPNLQVLEILDSYLYRESEWTMMEGQFLQLKWFRSSLTSLVKWEVEKEHLPSLETLILLYVYSIDEIPCGLGEIDSLQLIELHNCSESLVNSAKGIEEQQHENGNHAFQVHVVQYGV